MSIFPSHGLPGGKVLGSLLSTVGKHLPAIGNLLDQSVDGLFDFVDTTLARTVRAAGNGMVLGFIIGLAAIIPAYGAFGLFVTVGGCARPLDYVTALFPTFTDMPRPVGLPHR